MSFQRKNLLTTCELGKQVGEEVWSQCDTVLRQEGSTGPGEFTLFL